MAEKRTHSKAFKARKRQKIDLITPTRPNKASSSKSTGKNKSWKSVSLDSLNWKQVDMPDRLDDVEGFFGLEEIDDVQVVNNNGLLQFQTVDNSDATTTVSNVDEAKEAGDDDEWNGFADQEILETVEQTTTEKPKKVKEKKKTKTKLEKATVVQQPINPFTQLLDIETEEEEDEILDFPGWNTLSLSQPTIKALQKLKFSDPTPIQDLSIPEILAGHDVIGKASTGSGKTLAFGIPIFEKWLSTSQDRLPKDSLSGESKDDADVTSKLQNSLTAIILSPTRELAHQITNHIEALIRNSGLISAPQVVSLTGGLSIQKQIRKLTQNGGADIVVATPGRLFELLSDKSGFTQWFRKTQFLVIDEADRLLQEGHFKEVEEILDLITRAPADEPIESEPTYGKIKTQKHVPQNSTRQTLVFSATFSKDLQQKLSSKQSFKNSQAGLMNDKESLDYLLKKLPFREEHPKWVDVNPVDQMAENLREGLVECGNMEKDLYLYYLLLRYPLRTLIFTNSISTVKRLNTLFQTLQLQVNALHSNMIQKARLRALERFSAPSKSTNGSNKPTQSILISTDVAARGLDIKNIELVIHYHVPRTADTYVHRSGRTARSKNSGASIILCSPEEVSGIKRLISKVHEDRKSTNENGIKTIYVDRSLVTQLKNRIELAQKIAASTIAKESQRKEKDWLKTAAEDLGVDYSSDEFTYAVEKGRKGNQKRKEAREVSKDELAGLRARLSQELKQKIGKGSRLYLTSGVDNLAQRMVDQKSHDIFFGEEAGWGIDHL